MSESPPYESSKKAAEQTDSRDALDELRDLILEPEQVRLNKVEERLDDHRIRAYDVSRVLPEAIILRSSRDKLMAKALESTILEGIKTSVRKDRKTFVNIIFPRFSYFHFAFVIFLAVQTKWK